MQAQALLTAAKAFRCPLCGKTLHAEGMSLLCGQGHCFDVSRRGYVHLAPNAKPSQYDRALFESRARLLAAGFYDCIRDGVIAAAERCLAGKPSPTLLDAGCGDGYFTRAAAGLGRVIGLDLSQDAIIEACRAESSVLWLIGDLARPPLALGSVDLILNILSPANYPAFQSLLTPDGEVLKVVPAKDHLAELRELAKGSLADREYSNERVLALFEKELLLTEKTEIQKTLPLTREQARDFLYMTPLMQHVDRETIDLSKLTQIRVSAVLLRGRRR